MSSHCLVDLDLDDGTDEEEEVQPTLVVDCVITLSGGETGQTTRCREEMDLMMIMLKKHIFKL